MHVPFANCTLPFYILHFYERINDDDDDDDDDDDGGVLVQQGDCQGEMSNKRFRRLLKFNILCKSRISFDVAGPRAPVRCKLPVFVRIREDFGYFHRLLILLFG